MPLRGRRNPPPEVDGLGETFSGDEEDAPEITARPSERPVLEDADSDRVVPMENVGGAVPTQRGGDSGGDLPGPDDDLSNLAEPEPPDEAPEIGAMRVTRHQP